MKIFVALGPFLWDSTSWNKGLVSDYKLEPRSCEGISRSVLYKPWCLFVHVVCHLNLWLLLVVGDRAEMGCSGPF